MRDAWAAMTRWWSERVRWRRAPWRGSPAGHLPGWFRTVDEWGNRGVGLTLPLIGSLILYPRARLGRDRWFWVSACSRWVTYRSPDGRTEARVPRRLVPADRRGHPAPLDEHQVRRFVV